LEPTPEPSEHAPDVTHEGRHRRSARGAWTIVAIFAVGLAVLAGLMLVPRNKPPAVPPGVPWGAAGEAISLVTCDLSGQKPAVEALAAELRSGGNAGGPAGQVPDFLVVTHVGADDALAFARLMGMQSSYRPQHHQRVRGPGERGAGAGTPNLIGVALLSKHPLYEGGPLKVDRKRSAGVAAVAVVGGQKFRIACVYGGGPKGEGLAPLLEQRKAEEGPPTLLVLVPAGDAGAVTRHREMLSAEFAGVEPREDTSGPSLLVTREWRASRAAADTATGIALYVAEGKEHTNPP